MRRKTENDKYGMIEKRLGKTPSRSDGLPMLILIKVLFRLNWRKLFIAPEPILAV